MIISMALIAPTVQADPGVSGATILLQEHSARFAGLGGSSIAWQGSSDSILANPAGLASVTQNDLKFMHISGIEGLATEVLIGTVPVPELGGLGFQVIYRSAPTIDNEAATDATIEIKDMVFGAAVGIPLTKKLYLGAEAKVVRFILGPVDTANIALDLGSQYQLDDRWRVALAIQNLGPDIEWQSATDPMPITIAGAVHTSIYKKAPYDLQMSLETRYLIPDKMTSVHLGAELNMQDTIVLRMGGKVATEQTVNNFFAGVGFYFKIVRLRMALDFTFSPEIWDEGELELKNLISLSAFF